MKLMEQLYAQAVFNFGTASLLRFNTTSNVTIANAHVINVGSAVSDHDAQFRCWWHVISSLFQASTLQCNVAPTCLLLDGMLLQACCFS
jgi:hypothetical protein